MSQICDDEPHAWELQVRRSDSEWRCYNIYDKKTRAESAMRQIKGPPLEIRIVPLYAAVSDSETTSQLSDLRQQLAACQAALALKDEALKKACKYIEEEYEIGEKYRTGREALAIKPDNAALREWGANEIEALRKQLVECQAALAKEVRALQPDVLKERNDDH